MSAAEAGISADLASLWRPDGSRQRNELRSDQYRRSGSTWR